MSGKNIKDFRIKNNFENINHVCVKESVFPFSRFPGCEITLGPEMKSTGEVMGIDTSFQKAYAKSQVAAGNELPLKGNVFVSVNNEDKPQVIDACKKLSELGFEIMSTRGTSKYLKSKNIHSITVKKILEGRPNILDLMLSNQVQIIINTIQDHLTFQDSMILRRNAIKHGVPYFTSISGAIAAAHSIETILLSNLDVSSLQNYIN